MSDRELPPQSSVGGPFRPSAGASRALWPVFVAYLVAFFLVLVAGTLYVLVAAVPRAGWDPVRLADETTRFAFSAPGLLGVALVSAVMLALVTLGTARLMGGDVAARLNLRPTRARPLGIAAAVVALAGLSLACGSVAQLAGLGKGGVTASIATALRSSNPLRMAVAVLVLGVAPAFAEEGFFRGLMLTRLRARWSRWPAIVVTALAFGVFHVDPVQGSEAFVAGVFFGWVAERLGGIRPTIVAHAVNNGMFVVVASFAGHGDEPSRVAALGMLAAGVAVCGGATALLRSRYAVLPA
jgi:membrane protease YdiL (CAAX protease family)